MRLDLGLGLGFDFNRAAVGNFHGVNRQTGFRYSLDSPHDFVSGETLRRVG